MKDRNVKEWIWWLSFLSIIILTIDLFILLSYPVVDTTTVKHIQKYEQKNNQKAGKEIWQKAIATGYTLSSEETDKEPCLGAYNHNLCERQKEGQVICASRNLTQHTFIFIRGFGACEILDVTSRKYAGRLDILFKTKEEAINWGKKEVEYRVIQ